LLEGFGGKMRAMNILAEMKNTSAGDSDYRRFGGKCGF